MPTHTHKPLVLPPVAPEVAGCTWCGREIELLRKSGQFSETAIQVYADFYGIFGEDVFSLESVGKEVGLSDEEVEEVIMEVSDWLMANSPYRSLPRRCFVCGHAQGPEDLAHLKES